MEREKPAWACTPTLADLYCVRTEPPPKDVQESPELRPTCLTDRTSLYTKEWVTANQKVSETFQAANLPIRTLDTTDSHPPALPTRSRLDLNTFLNRDGREPRDRCLPTNLV